MGHRVIRLEPDVHSAPGRHVFGWKVAAAVSSDERRVGTAAVSDLHEIVPEAMSFSKMLPKDDFYSTVSHRHDPCSSTSKLRKLILTRSVAALALISHSQSRLCEYVSG